MATKLPSKSKRLKAAARAIEYRAIGKSWREIDGLVAREHPECATTAVLDAIYRLDHLDVEDWLPSSTVIPEPVQRYANAKNDFHHEVIDAWAAQELADARAWRAETGHRNGTPESRVWYAEYRKKRPVFVPTDNTMVADYRDLP